VKTTQPRAGRAGRRPVFQANRVLAPELLSCYRQIVSGQTVKRDERLMKTLLRKVSTGLYYQAPDRWTTNPVEAHNFKMIDRALQFVQQWHLCDMELAFAFEDPVEVTRVPLDKMELRYSEA
jgi:hypothetical protein